MADNCIFDKWSKCAALKSKECIGCSFRKTHDEYGDSRKKSRERIDSLDDDKKKLIYRTYYNAGNRRKLEAKA